MHRLPPGAPGVSRACKGIVRYIHAKGLGPGDRLPPQQELRGRLGFSNDTLSAAMGMLVKVGLLSRKTGRGTAVLSLEPLATLNWVVGIAGLVAPEQGPSAFFGDLLHRLLAKLSLQNCRANTYFLRPPAHWPQRLTDFTGLAEDVEDGLLDGLLVLTYLDTRDLEELRRRGVPAWHVGPWDTMPGATVVDRCGMLKDAMVDLLTEGARSVAVIDYDGATLVKKALTADDAGFPVQARALMEQAEVISFGRRVQDARAAAERLLAHDPGKRPDAIVLLDDYAAQHVAEVLLSDPSYRPRVAAITNRQLPLVFPLPVIRYELDIDGLADRAICSLRQRLLDPRLDGGIEYVRPRREPGAGEKAS